MENYLICDLDNSLIKTDSLYEQWLVLFRKKPFLYFKSFIWLLKGKAFFKGKIAGSLPLDPESLVYRDDVIEIIKDFRVQKKGRIILASAAPQSWVDAVAGHLNLFDHAIGSKEDFNLKGINKLRAIKDLIGPNQFIYIGDSSADLPIWKDSLKIIAVNPNKLLLSNINRLDKPVHLICDKKNQLNLLIKQLRPHQWVKNVLVFLPVIAGHKALELNVIANSILAFFGFSILASSVYVFNDLIDISADRKHHSKRYRPFASGDLSIGWGLILVPILLVSAGFISSFLPGIYFAWLFAYFILNIAYSFSLKQLVVLDIIILSFMYTLRIFAGSAASGIPISEWLLSFSTLFFFSLACVKRYTEIGRSKNKLTIDGRGYRQMDHAIVQNLGVGTGLLSILIVLLYLQSKEVRSLYTKPEHLWYITPILLYWISRIWLLTNRDQVNDDPVVFAVKDWVSWICLVIFMAIMIVSL